MESTAYDYAIIGAGAAGLHLTVALASDPLFQSNRVLVLDKDANGEKLPTWCYWEKGKGQWDAIVAKTWNKTAFINKNKRLELDLGNYTYKMVRGKDFYREVKKKVGGSGQVTWVEEEVNHLIPGQPNKIVTQENKTWLARHVFDSRIDPQFTIEPGKFNYLKQHFEGWVIETEKPVFDPEIFTMMDYRLIYQDTTSFIYILPFTPKKALVEYTFFSPDLVKKDVYQTYLEEYIKEILGVESYKVLKTENGVIPMTDYPLHRDNNGLITKIGTAGGWVKGSTGYSFKSAERKSQKILENIKSEKIPGSALTKRRFLIYDALFLDVLFNHNKKGPEIFADMYNKNNIQTIFSFLDEESTFIEELGIMNTFDRWLFVKTILKRVF